MLTFIAMILMAFDGGCNCFTVSRIKTIYTAKLPTYVRTYVVWCVPSVLCRVLHSELFAERMSEGSSFRSASYSLSFIPKGLPRARSPLAAE